MNWSWSAKNERKVCWNFPLWPLLKKNENQSAQNWSKNQIVLFFRPLDRELWQILSIGMEFWGQGMINTESNWYLVPNTLPWERRRREWVSAKWKWMKMILPCLTILHGSFCVSSSTRCKTKLVHVLSAFSIRLHWWPEPSHLCTLGKN